MRPENVLIISALLFFSVYLGLIAFLGWNESERDATLAKICIEQKMQWVDDNCVVKP